MRVRRIENRCRQAKPRVATRRGMLRSGLPPSCRTSANPKFQLAARLRPFLCAVGSPYPHQPSAIRSASVRSVDCSQPAAGPVRAY